MEYIFCGLVCLIIGFFVGMQIQGLPSKKEEKEEEKFFVDKEEYGKFKAYQEAESEENKVLLQEARELSQGY